MCIVLNVEDCLHGAPSSYSGGLGLLWVEAGPRRIFILVYGVLYYGDVGGGRHESHYVVGVCHD